MISVHSRGARAEDWAAELTMAAYVVALRHCPTGKWLDLQLELWRALTATLARGDGAGGPRRRPSEFVVRAEEFLAELADVAYRTALPYGRRQSFLDLELELYWTFCRTLRAPA